MLAVAQRTMPPRTVQNPNPNRASRSAVAAECGGDAADEDAAEAQNASEARAVEAVQRPDVTAAARATEPAQVCCMGMPGSFLARSFCAVLLV